MKKTVLFLLFLGVLAGTSCHKRYSSAVSPNNDTTNNGTPIDSTDFNDPNPFSFGISGVRNASVQKGGDEVVSLQLQRLTGYPEMVYLSMQNVPANVTATFSQAAGIPSSSSVFNTYLTFHANPNADTGTYHVKLIAKSASTDTMRFDITLKVTLTSECSIAVLGNFSDSTACNGATLYLTTSAISLNNIGLHRVNIANFAGMGYVVYADLNCGAGTITVPTQTLPNSITVDGTGTFNADNLTINYTQTTQNNNVSNCVVFMRRH